MKSLTFFGNRKRTFTSLPQADTYALRKKDIHSALFVYELAVEEDILDHPSLADGLPPLGGLEVTKVNLPGAELGLCYTQHVVLIQAYLVVKGGEDLAAILLNLFESVCCEQTGNRLVDHLLQRLLAELDADLTQVCSLETNKAANTIPAGA